MQLFYKIFTTWFCSIVSSVSKNNVLRAQHTKRIADAFAGMTAVKNAAPIRDEVATK